MNRWFLLLGILWAFFGVSGVIVWWHNRLPETRKAELFSAIWVALIGAFVLGLYLHPLITN